MGANIGIGSNLNRQAVRLGKALATEKGLTYRDAFRNNAMGDDNRATVRMRLRSLCPFVTKTSLNRAVAEMLTP